MFDPAEQAARDQMSAEIREFAIISKAIFDQYLQAGFDEDQALEIVGIWNDKFAELSCRL